MSYFSKPIYCKLNEINNSVSSSSKEPIDIFKKQYPYYVIFENASGLMPAHLVTINGMNVGNVDDIQLMPKLSNRVLVTINVNKEVHIPLNSIVRITTPNLLSSPQVEIVFSDEQKYIQAGDTVWGTIAPGMLDGLNGLGNVVSNVDTIMLAAKNLMTSDAMDSLTAAIADFHSITQNIDNILKQNSSKVNVAMSDLQSFASMLRENNDKITNIIGKISTVSDNLAEAEIKQAIDSLSIVVGRVFPNI